jgi:hypothetical protein
VTFNPLEWDYQTWRLLFGMATGWAVLVAFPGLVVPRTAAHFLYGVESDRGSTGVLFWLLSVAILGLAGGYGLVARDPASLLWLVVLGAVVNIVLAAFLIVIHIYERNSNYAAIMAMGGLFFAVFFVLYLVGGDRSPY